MNKAYYDVPLRPRSFHNLLSLYELVMMPVGFCVGGQTLTRERSFQGCGGNIFRSCEKASSVCKQQALPRTAKVMLGMKESSFLALVVSDAGIHVNPIKTRVIEVFAN